MFIIQQYKSAGKKWDKKTQKNNFIGILFLMKLDLYCIIGLKCQKMINAKK